MRIPFDHRQSAHCESGVTANLFTHSGLPLTEAMAFGIGGGLFFGYFPFIKVNYLPLTTYRKRPGGIIKNCAARLGGQIHRQKFHSPKKAMAALDHALAQGHPVGVQAGVYWLPYFPAAMRFHFNAHNLIVLGKKDDRYLISDPVFEQPLECHAADLSRARFAQGALAPNGHMYYVSKGPVHTRLDLASLKGLLEVARTMLLPSAGLIGVSAMRRLADQLEKWPEKLGKEKSLRYLGHVIRMQEEIGTGGGGFRFMFSAFLQEVSHLQGENEFRVLSDEMTQIGDKWREFALFSSRICKKKEKGENAFKKVAHILNTCADREEAVYRVLKHRARAHLKRLQKRTGRLHDPCTDQ